MLVSQVYRCKAYIFVCIFIPAVSPLENHFTLSCLHFSLKSCCFSSFLSVCFHSLSGRSRGHASFIYMCSCSLSKADLDHSMNHIRHPTDFSAAYLHFGSESIVPTLLPFSSHIPWVFVCQILGKLLGLTHSTKRLWRITLAQMCLSSFLPSLSTPSVLSPSLLLSVWAWLRSARTHDYRNAVCGSQLRQH